MSKAGYVEEALGGFANDRAPAGIAAPAYAAAKAAAMGAHATQIEVAEPYFALSNELAQPLFTTEYYELVRGRAGAGRETDLFAGAGEAS